MLNNIKIPDWISTRSYNLGLESSRSYLYNSITREFIFLEGVSSDFWNKILTQNNKKKIFSWIQEHDLSQDWEDFIQQLVNSGFISYGTKSLDTITSSSRYNADVESSSDSFFQELTEWGKLNNKLLNIFFELTYKCNEKCIHCFNHKNISNYELDFTTVKRIIDEAYELGLFFVEISGGESTLAKDFIKIIDYVHSKRLLLTIFTNGNSLYDDDELFNKIVDIRPYNVEISLYSLNPDIHDKITGIPGSFYKTFQVINRLKEKNISVVIKSFLTKYNIDSYSDLVKFAEDNDMNIVQDELFLNNLENDNSHVGASDLQIESYYKKSTSTIEKTKRKCSLFEIPCKAGHTSIAINPQKKVFPCNVFEFDLGNLNNQSIAQIWNDNNPASPLNVYRNIHLKDIEDCFKYPYCDYCNYCPGHSFIERKKIGQADSLCRSAKIKYNLEIRR